MRLNIPARDYGFGLDQSRYEIVIPDYECDDIPLFLDFDGDGRADALCISANGALSAWQNTLGDSPGQPKWIRFVRCWKHSDC